jgi:hypothetical protein
MTIGLLVSFFPWQLSVAAIYIDQGYRPSTTGHNTIVAARYETAQTFTVGLSGTMTSVDVQVARFGFSPSDVPDDTPLTLDIRRTVNGIPVESNSGPEILASVRVLAASLPISDGFGAPFVNFDLPDFLVAVGDTLAIVMQTPAGPVLGGPDDTPFIWTMDDPGAYSRGRIFVRGISAHSLTWNDTSLAGADHSFRTFVDSVSPPIPEPAPFALLVSGLALIGAIQKRRRRLTRWTSLLSLSQPSVTW